MIGWPGVLLEMVELAVALLFALGASIQWKRKPSIRIAFLTLMFTLAFALLCRKQALRVEYLRTLHTMRPDSVRSISVNSVLWRNEVDKYAIVNALNGVQWFVPQHAGWRKPMKLSVQMTSGARRDYEIALYKYGAVVLAAEPRGPGDEAFSSSLPSILTRMGAPLPTDITQH